MSFSSVPGLTDRSSKATPATGIPFNAETVEKERTVSSLVERMILMVLKKLTLTSLKPLMKQREPLDAAYVNFLSLNLLTPYLVNQLCL